MKSIRIKELRTEAGLTQQELADRIGISKQAVSMYELGHRRPSFDIADALADYFGVSIGYLSGSTNRRDPYPGGQDLRITADERALLDAYRTASDEIRSAARAVLGVR